MKDLKKILTIGLVSFAIILTGFLLATLVLFCVQSSPEFLETLFFRFESLWEVLTDPSAMCI